MLGRKMTDRQPRNPFRWPGAAFCLFLLASLSLGAQQFPPPDAYVAGLAKFRQKRDQRLRGPFSPLSLVHREYLRERTRATFGSSAAADIRLEGDDIAPLHAVLEGASTSPVLRVAGKSRFTRLATPSTPLTELRLEDATSFRIGRFNLLYKLHVSWGRIIEVYDSAHPAFQGFTGLDYFPIDPAYRVTAEVVPHRKPEKIYLVDSQGNERSFWLYGELRFHLQGTECWLELYTQSLEPEEIENGQFMLIFSDATSGKETYPAARYLYTEAKAAGPIPVDFNRAFSPPCVFSSVYTCPFPRPQNRLPVAVRAGEKWYRLKSPRTQ